MILGIRSSDHILDNLQAFQIMQNSLSLWSKNVKAHYSIQGHLHRVS